MFDYIGLSVFPAYIAPKCSNDAARTEGNSRQQRGGGKTDDLDFPMRWRLALVFALFSHACKQFALFLARYFTIEDALHNASSLALRRWTGEVDYDVDVAVEVNK